MEHLAKERIWTLNVAEEVRQHLKNESSGHDPWHAFRVRQLGAQIAAAIGADRDVVEAAALLHDIGHADGRDHHAQRGAALAARILSGSGFPADKIGAVTNCIEHHHWQADRAGDPRQPTLEYQAFADADRLDALGAIGIARAFAFGGAHDRPIWDPDPERTASGPYGVSSIHHFYDKLLRLQDDMYTAAGRELAARRVAVMQEFLRTFYAEWDAGDVEAILTGVEPPVSLNALLERPIQVGDRVRRRSTAVLQSDPIN
jgi:uncharacterized protein